MARNKDGHGILRHGLADFLSSRGLPDRFCNFAVSARLSRRNFASGFVDLPEKRSNASQVHRDAAKVLHFSLKMFANFLDDCGDFHGRHAVLSGTSLARNARFGGLRSPLGKLNSSHDRLRTTGRRFVPSDAACAKRRFKEAVGSIVHNLNSISGPSYSSMLAERYPLFDLKLKPPKPARIHVGDRLREALS